MSATNPLSDSALQPEPDANDALELPTQPWHLPPEPDAARAFEPEFHAADFEFHDTIPAPPWLDEAGDPLELPSFSVP